MRGKLIYRYARVLRAEPRRAPKQVPIGRMSCRLGLQSGPLVLQLIAIELFPNLDDVHVLFLTQEL